MRNTRTRGEEDIPYFLNVGSSLPWPSFGQGSTVTGRQSLQAAKEATVDRSGLRVENRRGHRGDRARPWEWDVGTSCAWSHASWNGGRRFEYAAAQRMTLWIAQGHGKDIELCSAAPGCISQGLEAMLPR